MQINGYDDLEAIAEFRIQIERPVIAQTAGFDRTLAGLEYVHDASGGQRIRNFAA